MVCTLSPLLLSDECGVKVVLLIANSLPVDICHHLIVRSRSDAVIRISLAYRSRPK